MKEPMKYTEHLEADNTARNIASTDAQLIADAIYALARQAQFAANEIAVGVDTLRGIESALAYLMTHKRDDDDDDDEDQDEEEEEC